MKTRIQIVPQKREFGCAKAVIKTIIKTKFELEIEIQDSFWYFKSLGTLNFLSMANDVFRENKLPGRFIKKTNVKFEEITRWMESEMIIVILFISRENYPHYALLASVDEDQVIIANPQGAIFEGFNTPEFIERFYLNPRYVNHIQWKKGKYHPIRDKCIRWGVRLGKSFGIIRPATVYILEWL